MTINARWAAACLCAVLATGGCRSPYYADQGTAAGALGGAGIGALIGRATGHTAAGAIIGAAAGAVGGNLVGTAIDNEEAKNRAAIAAQLGRPVVAGTATPGEVISMTRAGVDQQLIINYVNSAGMAQPISAQDVIYLNGQGVATPVIQAMQTSHVPPPVAAGALASAPPVVVEEYPGPYYDPYWHPYYHCYRPGPRFGWGLSVWR
ncbi:MAG TPA: glycine zipper domain-containing protein [Lacipirellulaceae bacterium]